MKLSEFKEMVMKVIKEDIDETYVAHKDEVDKLQAERDKAIQIKDYKTAKAIGDKILLLVKSV